MVDKSSILGMELRYRHSYHGEVSVDFALPLRAITELAAYTAYWPATSESARFRLLSRPLQQGEKGEAHSIFELLLREKKKNM